MMLSRSAVLAGWQCRQGVELGVVQVTSAAVALAVTSSAASAPTIAEATAGRDSSQT
jgi:hypothetical protein